MAQYRQTAQPVKYTSQFDPGMEQMSQQILLRSQNKYDTAFGGTAEEQSRLGSMFFLDENAKQQALGKLEQSKQDILKRYNGDYGAASKDLANLIVKERNNPIYGLNVYQQQKAAEAGQIKSKLGPNAIVRKDVASTLIDPETGRMRQASDFDYDIQERSDYDDAVRAAAVGIEKTIRESDLSDAKKEGYLQTIKTTGLANLNKTQREELATIIGSKLDKETTLGYDPLYEGVKGKDYAMDAIPRLLSSGIEKDFKYDQMAEDSRKRVERNTPKSSPTGMYSFIPRSAGEGTNNIGSNNPTLRNMRDVYAKTKDYEMNKSNIDLLEAANQGKDPNKFKIQGENFNDYVKLVEEVFPTEVARYFDNVGGYYTLKHEGNKLERQAAEEFVKNTVFKMSNNLIKGQESLKNDTEKFELEYKKQYGDVINALKATGKKDDEILDIIQNAENTHQFNDIIDTNNKDFNEGFPIKLIRNLSANVKLYDVDENGDYSESKKSISDLKKLNPIGTLIDPQNGGLIITYDDGSKQAVKGESLDKTGKTYLDLIGAMTSKLNNATKLEETLPVADRGDYRTQYKIIRDVDNGLQPIILYQMLDKDGKIVMNNRMSIGQVYEDLSSKIMQSQGYTSDLKPQEIESYYQN